MKQNLFWFVLGIVCAIAWNLVDPIFAQMSNEYWSMTPLEKQQFDQQQMLNYNFNRALQQHNYTPHVPHPC